MPRYLFNVHGSSSDRDGIELASIADAKCEAVKLAGRLICEGAGKFWNEQEFGMSVSDDEGLTLFSLHLFGMDAAAIRFEPRP